MPSYKQQKLNLKPGEALIHVDYSESYSISQQYEVQFAYFGQQNFSMFISCSYYQESGEDNLTKVPMAVIRESNIHSRIAAFSCIATIVSELKNLMGETRKETADLVTFTEETLNGKLHFLCSGRRDFKST